MKEEYGLSELGRLQAEQSAKAFVKAFDKELHTKKIYLFTSQFRF
jgi:hypothetical protein